MRKPSLIIMAAGLGSRFGGLKQITPVGDKGEIIMDFSLYDAHKAGFEKVIFVIKRERKRTSAPSWGPTWRAAWTCITFFRRWRIFPRASPCRRAG